MSNKASRFRLEVLMNRRTRLRSELRGGRTTRTDLVASYNGGEYLSDLRRNRADIEF